MNHGSVLRASRVHVGSVHSNPCAHLVHRQTPGMAALESALTAERPD